MKKILKNLVTKILQLDTATTISKVLFSLTVISITTYFVLMIIKLMYTW